MKRSLFFLAAALPLLAWGPRAHRAINGAAVDGLPDDGPVFLKTHREWIAFRSSSPDLWRLPTEPHLRIDEDPNHGWFREQFAFLSDEDMPRSRHEFLIALHNRHLKTKDPLLNVRWTGTLAYAMIEGYERLKTTMRFYRQASGDAKKYFELDLAFYMGWLGHYTADGAQPLHCTIHHDGWQGENPNAYTTDRRVHGRVETAFVDKIEAEAKDLVPRLKPAQRLADPFAAIVAHLRRSSNEVERVYQLDKAGAWDDPTHEAARELTYARMTDGAQLLRDLTYTAWLESATPFTMRGGREPGAVDTIDPKHPRYNPETGSAPPTRPK